jgi:hypothetical protein
MYSIFTPIPIPCTNTWCGYEVPGIILLPVYLYTCSLLRGVTFKVLPFSSYALSPTMLHCWKYFWNTCCGIAFGAIVTFCWMSSMSQNFHSFKADFIFGNSQKSFTAKRGTRLGVPFHWLISGPETSWQLLVRWSIVVVKNVISQSSGHFLYTASCNCFSIST